MISKKDTEFIVAYMAVERTKKKQRAVKDARKKRFRDWLNNGCDKR